MKNKISQTVSFFNSACSLSQPSFIQKGYYAPLVLSNGVDFCQLDFSGTMGFKDHIKGYMSYWYKKGRPAGPDPKGIAKFSYHFVSDKGAVEIGDSAQFFDPHAAVLYTRVSLYQLDMKITSFLTEDHTFLEIFEIENCDSLEASLVIKTIFQDKSYTDKPIAVFAEIPNAISLNQTSSMEPYFTYAYSDRDLKLDGIGLTGIKLIQGDAKLVKEENKSNSGIIYSVSRLRKGTIFARISTLMDNLDSHDYNNDAMAIHTKYMRQPMDVSFNEYVKTREEFDSPCKFSCSDESLSRTLDVALYSCRASLHPNGSTVSALAIPNSHGMGTYWDVWFVHRALLASNSVNSAKKIIDFWRLSYATAKKQAREKYGVEGARYAWALRYDGTPSYDADQLHNNMIPLLNIWDQYLYTQDENILHENFDIMVDCVLFIILNALIKDDKDRYHLRKLKCLDESLTYKRDELVTAAITRRSIDIILEASKIIKRDVNKIIPESISAFDDILNSLKRDGIYEAYENSDIGNWAIPLAYLHLPDSDIFPKAISHALEGCREKYGLGLSRTSRMRCATFPWVEGIFSWSMSVNRDPRAVEYLLKMNRFTNFYGGIPEYVWIHGEPSREWFVAAHGAFILALLEIIVGVHNNAIEVLPLGKDIIPWEKCSICNLRLPGALIFSMDFDKKAGKCNISFKNVTAKERKIKVKYGKMEKDLMFQAEEAKSIDNILSNF
ncbi:MAG: hypothetical protein ACYC2P_13490 [Paludibacteraceae bacterium]